jgi:hypothetical protein
MPAAMKTPTHTYRFAYSVGDLVFHRLASERVAGMVTGLYAAPDGVGYHVTWPDRAETRHYECELTSEYVPDYAGD